MLALRFIDNCVKLARYRPILDKHHLIGRKCLVENAFKTLYKIFRMLFSIKR